MLEQYRFWIAQNGKQTGPETSPGHLARETAVARRFLASAWRISREAMIQEPHRMQSSALPNMNISKTRQNPADAQAPPPVATAYHRFATPNGERPKRICKSARTMPRAMIATTPDGVRNRNEQRTAIRSRRWAGRWVMEAFLRVDNPSASLTSKPFARRGPKRLSNSSPRAGHPGPGAQCA